MIMLKRGEVRKHLKFFNRHSRLKNRFAAIGVIIFTEGGTIPEEL